MAQEHDHQNYIAPTDSSVIRKLAQWQDYKFGLLMHWAPSSQWGVVESWSICPEDEDWCTRRGPYANDYSAYVKAYENLQTTFNPIKFNPEKWAKAANYAGMKYMVFTTKHHDGFSMFDSQYTDYKITNSKTPFSTHLKANITKEVFDAFRNEGMWVGAYFSKPDWHCDDYWWPKFPTYDRNPNYDLNRYSEKWNAYKSFTQNQLNELMTNYGNIDILWLDGGWVQPLTATSPRWGYKPVHQDIEMDVIAAKARKIQPGLIVVDRAVEGPNQNYLTPEQKIPDSPLPYPWESCMTMGTSWSHVKNETYKSSFELIKTLCLIVSRGGNLLLNIGPDATGEWDSTAYQRLKEIGDWMSVNHEAIYETKPIFPYEYKIDVSTKFVFTEAKNGSVYAILICDKKVDHKIELDLSTFKKHFKEIDSLSDKEYVQKISKKDSKITIKVPNINAQKCLVFKLME
ncbi:MAG: alpha-L-fucosidase [Crocinitomicaceae bacterium]|nr:alpha-L-fucosidase [Crocinitomicaceae bacterium]